MHACIFVCVCVCVCVHKYVYVFILNLHSKACQLALVSQEKENRSNIIVQIGIMIDLDGPR